MSTVTAVIVCYDEQPDELRAAIDGLRAQTPPPDEILVVDNGPGTLTAALEGHAPEVRLLHPGANLGYPPAVNYAAERANGDYLFCLNPDARAEPDCLRLLLETAETDLEIAVTGAQILFADGKTTNAGANPLHPSGVSPSGNYGHPREHGPPRDVMVVSGACCLMRRETFLALGGFVDEFFLYYDDADYGWRARIAGKRVVYCPEAAVRHNYEFGRRKRKWFYVERNRMFSVLANYELRTLVILAPLLIAIEAGIVGLSAIQGWLPEKLQAYRSVLAMHARIREQRRLVARLRRKRDVELLELFRDHIDTPLLPRSPTAVANLLGWVYMPLAHRALR